MAAPVTVDLCQSDYQPPDQADADNVASVQPSPQEEYNFVERPSEDYFCPVTLDLLLDPHQTACCGHHLSHEAAAQLQREGKPCPVCKQPNLVTVVDKFFQRMVKELRVRCDHKAGGCEWVGEVGSRDQHLEACPKHPWECEYCQEKGLYEIREGHVPNCTHRPTPCPNKCEVGSVAWCKLHEHVAMCPLQPVECEFSHAGCNVVVQRREMARHMEEGTQQHLLAATLLNLSLTSQMRADMQGKMEEMRVEIQGRMEEVERKQQTRMEELLQVSVKEMRGKMEEVRGKMEKMEGRLQVPMKVMQRELEENDKQITQLHEQVTDLRACFLDTFGFDFTVTDWNPKKMDWYSNPFYVPFPGQYKFQLNVDITDGKIRAYLKYLRENGDDRLFWPITITGRLTLLNQLGDHGHHSVGSIMKQRDHTQYKYHVISLSFISCGDLLYNAQRGTQYVRNNCLYFRLHIKVTSYTR